MFYLGRLISAFFNQLFRWLFWNKTGQKVLFTIVIFAIAVCFIKLGEVSAVEEVQDINYEVNSYYDSVVNDAIYRLGSAYISNPNSTIFNILKNSSQDYIFYFYYGNMDGSSYNNSTPFSNRVLYIAYWNNYYGASLDFTPTTNDYRSVTGYTMYNISSTHNTARINAYQFNSSILGGPNVVNNLYAPLLLFGRNTDNWTTFIASLKDNNTEQIIELLNTIEEDLSNTTPDQESEDSIIVDSSATDSVDTSEIDSVFSSAFTSFANKFTYYDLSDADQWVITINGTRIVLRSDILYNMIHNTWFYPMLQLLWYYIFGHYAFVWLTNLIHKIKDGSILDGLEVNEVISKEML